MVKKQKLEEELKQEILQLEEENNELKQEILQLDEENNELKCRISELEAELGICKQGTRVGEE